ncbi:O-antigen ligase family protein [Actinomycetospora flava]|uniref:O-antigen ligase family protein n=1 Tax=Actinomycetospora flava TaxID=3129232 RepID=A0ABU8M6C5_9PSEU
MAGGALACLAAFRSRGGQLEGKAIHVVMVLAISWAALSMVLAGTMGPGGLFALFDRFGVGLFLVFAIAPCVYWEDESREFLFRVFAVLGIYLSIVSIGQLSGIPSLVWPSYILDPNVGIHIERARGPYVESVANGLMLSYSAAFAVGVALVDRSRRWRVAGGVVAALCAVGILLTLTRAIWLGAAAAAIAATILIPQLRRLALPGAVTLILAVGLVYTFVPGVSEGAEARAEDEYPVWDRLNTNSAGARMLESNPVAGIGWNNSASKMVEYIRQGDTYPVSVSSGQVEIHNVFLSRLAEIGIPGFVLWLAVLVMAVVAAVVRVPDYSSLEPLRSVLAAMLIVWTFAAMLGPAPYLQPNYVLWTVAGAVSLGSLVRLPPRASTWPVK